MNDLVKKLREVSNTLNAINNEVLQVSFRLDECENERCVRGTDEYEAELWAKDQLKIEPQESEVKE